MEISCLRTWKQSKNGLDVILDIFFDYLNVIKGSFRFTWMPITKISHLA